MRFMTWDVGVFVPAMFADWLDGGWQKGALVYARMAKVHPDMAPEITCVDGETDLKLEHSRGVGRKNDYGRTLDCLQTERVSRSLF